MALAVAVALAGQHGDGCTCGRHGVPKGRDRPGPDGCARASARRDGGGALSSGTRQTRRRPSATRLSSGAPAGCASNRHGSDPLRVGTGDISTAYAPTHLGALRHSGGMALLTGVEGAARGGHRMTRLALPGASRDTITRLRTAPGGHVRGQYEPGPVTETTLRASVQALAIVDRRRLCRAAPDSRNG